MDYPERIIIFILEPESGILHKRDPFTQTATRLTQAPDAPVDQMGRAMVPSANGLYRGKQARMMIKEREVKVEG